MVYLFHIFHCQQNANNDKFLDLFEKDYQDAEKYKNIKIL